MPDGIATVSTDRADRVAEALADSQADLLLVTDLVNVRWLTGFTGSSAAAVVGRGGDRRFVTDFRYLTQSAEQLAPVWEREIAVDLLAGVVKGLPGTGDLRLAFDDGDLSVKDHARLAGMLRAGIELVPAGEAIEPLRAVKDDGELDAIRAAARLADDALTEVLGRGLVGRTEREVALDLEFTMRRMGAEAASFPPIVAAGDARRAPARVAARRRDPGGNAVRRRLGRAARRLRVGLHAHLRDRRDRSARRGGLRARPARPGGGARRGARGPDGPRGRRRRARDHRRRRPRRALRPRPRARRRARGARGPAAVQARRHRAGGGHGRDGRARRLRARRGRRAHRGPRRSSPTTAPRSSRRCRRTCRSSLSAGQRLVRIRAERLKISGEEPKRCA